MATKADLEKELAALKAELAALRKTSDETPDRPANPAQSVISSLKEGDLEGLANELTAELESALNDKPLMTALGLVVLGYALGRAR